MKLGDKTTTRRRRRWMSLSAAFVALAVTAAITTVSTLHAQAATLPFTIQSLDGSGNNIANPNWGKAGQPYLRVAPARYADGRSQPFGGPNTRFVSNRVITDAHQDLFSEHRVSQWGNLWGQFVDHNVGHRDEAGEAANIPFNANDPQETFTNTLGVIPFNRSKAAPGTGVTNARQQINTQSSYLDAEAVYGTDTKRLEWLREGSVDGNVSNNGARLLLPSNLLPRRDARGNPATAPEMAADGRLLANPVRGFVAGDVRANENFALSATHLLFAREHNRIVAKLPNTLTNQEKFEIARRIVIAEIQYITYNEFLPAMGVNLPMYTGYKSNVDASESNEFATVGYRAHSMIHGDIVEIEAEVGDYTAAELEAIEDAGGEVEVDGDELEIGVPLGVGFFNPDLLPLLHVGNVLKAVGGESEYKNDEQIDNQLRSVLFQVPVSGNPECLVGPTMPECFQGVVDLGAIDVERGREHGMPTYNQLRVAYGLPAKTSFTAITGEASESFPPGLDANNPRGLDFVTLNNIDGVPLAVGSEEGDSTAVRGTRRTTLAARMRAVYGSVNNVDAFMGMIAERHGPNSEMGELQLAIWAKQFAATRDGDRYFYGNNPGLTALKDQYGLDFHVSLGDVIAANTEIPRSELNDNVFLVKDADLPAAACTISYNIFQSGGSTHEVSLRITNNLTTPIDGWALEFSFASGQRVTQLWNGNVSQTGSDVRVTNASWNSRIGAGFTDGMVGFNLTWDTATDPKPPNFKLNGRRCARG